MMMTTTTVSSTSAAITEGITEMRYTGMTNFGLTPLGTRPAAPRPDDIDEHRATFATAVIAAGKLRRSEPLSDAERAALDAYADDEAPIDAQSKAVAEQVILAGRIRRNEV